MDAHQTKREANLEELMAAIKVSEERMGTLMDIILETMEVCLENIETNQENI
jgi:uncharacterized protein YqgV (UPF0045/DUF77 family)